MRDARPIAVWLAASLTLAACGGPQASAPGPRPSAPAAVSEAAPASTASAPAGEAVAPRADRRIVFLGDSLTAGLGVAVDEAYPSVLARRLESRQQGWTVVNAGVSGDTSAGGL
ncbi:MAG: GDSL-type esterase/lipase family protein, partial [Vicinamibacterales bacterium]